MFLFYFSMSLTVLSGVLYHVAQKLTPGNINPTLSLVVTYATAVVICLGFLVVHPPATGIIESLGQLNWASFALALAILGLEVGFLLAYRVGWNISLGAIVSNVSLTVVLVPVGWLFFREKISLMNLVGIVVCIVGMLMVNHR